MELLKGVIFDKGEVKLDNRAAHKYLISFVLITDDPINDIVDGHETIIGYGSNMHDDVTRIMKATLKYKPPYNLGDVSMAMILVSQTDIGGLEEIKDK